MAKGKGIRCVGYECSDGVHFVCTREEHGCGRPDDQNDPVPGWLHRLRGPCPCGTEHAPESPPRERSAKFRSRSTDFVYHDPDGKPAHKTRRTDGPKGKSFSQYRWSDGGWKPGLDGGPLHLYNLPALIRAANTEPEQWVHVVEGEKKAERLAELGLLATCNAMGAGGWRPDYVKWLRDRNVAVLEDNDEAGRKWGDAIISSLQGHAKCVKRVSFPDLPEHGDVYDWLAQGHTADELAEMVEAAPAAVVREPGRGIDFMSKSSKELKAVSWLWPGWVPMGAVTVVCGRPEAGKSKLWLELVSRLARPDLPWPDGQPQGDLPEGVRRVALYVDTEAMQHATSKRIEGKGLNQVTGLLLCVNHPDEPGSILATHNLRDKKSREALVRTVEVERPALVVIDSLGGAVAGGKENDSETMAPMMQLLARIARDHTCAVLVIAHPRKAVERGEWGEIVLDDIRGSSVIGQFARSVLVIDDPDQTEAEKPDDVRHRRLRSVKSSFDMKPKPLGLRHSNAFSLEFDQDPPRPPRRKSKFDQAVDWLRDQLSDGPQGATELMGRAKAEGHTEKTLNRAKSTIGIVSRQERDSQGEMRHRWYLPARADERAESEAGGEE